VRLRVAAALVGALGCVAACASDQIVPVAAPRSTTTTVAPNPAGRVVVLAATPIAPTVRILGEHFTALHPGVEIAIIDGSANGLVNQIAGGLAGDVFASVGSPAVDQLAIDGHLELEPFVFATDPLVVIVPPGNPEGVKGIDDLANADRTIALCSLDSACGQATDAALMKAGITASPDVVATDGAAVVQAVTTGRATAGLAYRTDVTASVGFLDLGVDLEAQVPAIAVKLAATTNPDAADAFISYLFSPEAKEVLATIGLVPPAA
jgi:molybdate transport system substrate-binding protein